MGSRGKPPAKRELAGFMARAHFLLSNYPYSAYAPVVNKKIMIELHN
jgi:hypothetical protein